MKFKTQMEKGRKSPLDNQISLPPMLDVTVKAHHRYRFRASSACQNQAVGVGSIIQAIGVIAATTTHVYSMASSFKIDAITIYPPQVAGSDSVSINWSSGASFGITQDSEMSRTLPDGITTTGKCVFKPSRYDLSADWLSANNGASNSVFAVTCPTGSIIDLDIDFTLCNVFGGADVGITGPATVGSVYYTALDGPGSNKIRPVLLNSIV
jgi:hypothetical protein